MKSIISINLLISLLLLFTSCPPPEDYYYEYSAYKPILMTRTDLENSIKFWGAENLNNPGNIYYKTPYLYIVEKFKGVHVINNTDPANPVNVGFICIPGCSDMAIKQSLLYVDNASDLVTIDLADNTMANMSFKSRVRNVFPEILPPDNKWLRKEYRQENRPENTIVVGWKLIGTN